MEWKNFNNPDDIRLVVVDMDGTLLDSEKRLPEGIFDLIDLLDENGVRFAVATGRQYWNIRELFKPVIDKISVLADNGGCTFDCDEYAGAILLPKDRVSAYLDRIKQIDGAWPILCGVKKAYIDHVNDEFLINTAMYYRRFELVEDLADVEEKDIIKIAIYDLEKSQDHCFQDLKGFSDEVQVKVSGEHWVDMNEKTCNKGVGVRILQDKMGITKDQTMVFGDFLNDSEMMSEATYSYAMANAHPDLKKLANFKAPSNDDNGVVRVIESRFGLERVDEAKTPVKAKIRKPHIKKTRRFRKVCCD